MYQKNFVTANDGNISCKLSDDIILTTPTSLSKGLMTEDMLAKMRLDGTALSPKPTLFNPPRITTLIARLSKVLNYYYHTLNKPLYG